MGRNIQEIRLLIYGGCIMYTLRLFDIGYTRDAHRHFVSEVAEDTFFNKYALQSAPIVCNRVFNPKAREFSINITEISEYEKASYLIATHNGKFYYYYITDYNVINGLTVVYKVEEDIYHTYFNNRGNFFNFIGRLSQSNSNSDDIIYPTGTPFRKQTEQNFFTAKKFVPIAYLNLKTSGIATIRLNKSYTILQTAISEILDALSSGNLDLYANNAKQTNETFNLLGVYIIPESLLEEKTNPFYYWKTTDGVYTFYSATGLKVSSTITPNKKTSNFFGTPFKKINIGNEQKPSVIEAQLFLSNGDPSLLLSVNGTTFLNVIDDFAITGAYSEFSNYLTQNKISLAMNVVSAVAGFGTAIATQNPLPAISAVKTAIDTGNAVYQESIKEQSIVTNGGGNAIATYEKSNLAGITIQNYTAKRQENIDNNFLAFGGECSGKYISISEIVSTDGNQLIHKDDGFFYRFSYIGSGSGGTLSGSAFLNKIADMFTSGIRIYYIQE